MKEYYNYISTDDVILSMTNYLVNSLHTIVDVMNVIIEIVVPIFEDNLMFLLH